MRFSFNFEDGSDIVIRATKEDYDSKFFVWDADRTYPNAQKTGLTYEQAKWLTENFEWIESDRTQPSIMFSCLVDLFEAYSLNSILDYLKYFKHKLRSPEKSQKELWVEWYRCEFNGDKPFVDFNYITVDEDGEVNYHDNKPLRKDDYFVSDGFSEYLGLYSTPGNLDWKQSCIAVSEIWPEVGVRDSHNEPVTAKMITEAKLDSILVNDEGAMSLSYTGVKFMVGRIAELESVGCDESTNTVERHTSESSQSPLMTSKPIWQVRRPQKPSWIAVDMYEDADNSVIQHNINLKNIKISHEKTLSEYRESQRQVIETRNKTFDTVAGLGIVSKITGR